LLKWEFSKMVGCHRLIFSSAKFSLFKNLPKIGRNPQMLAKCPYTIWISSAGIFKNLRVLINNYWLAGIPLFSYNCTWYPIFWPLRATWTWDLSNTNQNVIYILFF
jgi:hypothetical protein